MDERDGLSRELNSYETQVYPDLHAPSQCPSLSIVSLNTLFILYGLFVGKDRSYMYHKGRNHISLHY